MADLKTYLNVPYAQKDAAKALGARWDPAKKKWYAPADKDLALFAQWQLESGTATPSSAATITASAAVSAAKAGSAGGVITKALDKNFTPYNGDAPPWD